MHISTVNMASTRSIHSVSLRTNALRVDKIRTPVLDRPRRFVSTYGYVQAKALVYGKHGDPKDVLSYFAPRIRLH